MNNETTYRNIFEDAEDLFERKSEDYTNSSGEVFEDSGLMGQFMKIRDKSKKLKKPMWDAEIVREAKLLGLATSSEELIKLQFEDTEEILMDLMGHAVLAISILRKRKAAAEAKTAAMAARSIVSGRVLGGEMTVSETGDRF